MANKTVTIKPLPENGSTGWQLGKLTYSPGEQEVEEDQVEALRNAGLLNDKPPAEPAAPPKPAK